MKWINQLLELNKILKEKVEDKSILIDDAVSIINRFSEVMTSLESAPVDGYDEKCYHECPNCNSRCNCNSQPCSCCSAPVDDVVEMAKKYSERYDDEEDSDNCKSVSTAAYEAGHASRQPEIDALQKRVEELEGKYESDKDNDYEETLPEFCSNCGAEYDEIDYEYQICHLCGCGQTTTEKTNNH